MKKVLFIAYHFPPIAGGGTFRSLKFVKYLPEFGWMPTVLTTNSKTSWAYDNELQKEIPSNIEIIRSPEINLFYLQVLLSRMGLNKLYQSLKDHLFIPDEKIGWLPLAYYQAIKELKKEKYDLIFSTSPTICAHIIALKLKRKFNLPWVCDFRDYWTMHFTYRHKKTARGKYEQQLEHSFFQNADRIITVSGGVKRDFLAAYPDSVIRVITNGYDGGGVSGIRKSTEFKILYTGSFYGHYNPALFLSAVQKAVEEQPTLKRALRLFFAGNYPPDIKMMFAKYQESFTIDYVNFMSPNQLEKEYLSAAILLLILPADKHYKTYLPAKLFSYLNKSHPVFAVIPDGEAKSLLQKSNIGFFANPNSADDIKNQIITLYQLWRSGNLKVEPNDNFIRKFQRRHLTESLAIIFNQLLNHKR